MSEYRLYRVLRNAEGKHVGNEYMGNLVTCKECRHGTYYEDAEMYICNAIDQVAFDADHFCSYGERRE